MGRNILAIIAGYLSMAAFVFITFTILYLILGTEGSFETNSFRVSGVWIVMSILLGIAGALLGGYICALISKDRKTAFVLAGMVLVLGLLMAIPSLGGYSEAAGLVRDGSLSNMEAMQSAKQPDVILLLNPVIGAIGVYFGSRFWKEKRNIEVEPA